MNKSTVWTWKWIMADVVLIGSMILTVILAAR